MLSSFVYGEIALTRHSSTGSRARPFEVHGSRGGQKAFSSQPRPLRQVSLIRQALGGLTRRGVLTVDVTVSSTVRTSVSRATHAPWRKSRRGSTAPGRGSSRRSPRRGRDSAMEPKDNRPRPVRGGVSRPQRAARRQRLAAEVFELQAPGRRAETDGGRRARRVPGRRGPQRGIRRARDCVRQHSASGASATSLPGPSRA